MFLFRIFGFVTVFSLVTYALHRYFWARLIRDAALSGPWARGGTWLLVALAVSVPFVMTAARVLPRAFVEPLSWAAFLWMGVAFYLFVFLLGGDALRTTVERLGSLAGPFDPSRRTLLARSVALFAGVGAVGVGGVGFAAANGPPALERVRVRIRNLSAQLRGYRVVQLSDVHVGPTLGRAFLEDVVTRVNALSPDLVVITGDLVDGSVDALREHVAPLAGLRARDGVFFVTGNHEYYSGADSWIAHLATLGIRVLRNEHVPLRGSEGFDLAGVDDASAHQFGNGHGADYARALGGRDPARPVILLAHQPKQVRRAAPLGVDLILSGHTHGGQLKPFDRLVRIDQPYLAGLHRHDTRTQVYVNRGTGYWGPPMRVGVPSEITLLELHPETTAQA